MLFPVRANYRVTDGYYAERKTGYHRAWDIACVVGTQIHAPEDGAIWYHYILRDSILLSNDLWWDGRWYPFSNYFADIYGGLVCLRGNSGYTHVFAHPYLNQLFNKGVIPKASWVYHESAGREEVTRSWVTYDNLMAVDQGDLIGFSGNDGKSTGPHIHYEIHRGEEYDLERVNPATIYTRVKHAHS
jgi:murein DD-endopeptidase MepM/ murein hydrolase activator NlpD